MDFFDSKNNTHLFFPHFINIIRKDFGDLIRYKRLSKGFSLDCLSENLGISTRYLYKIEKGESSISFVLFLSLCYFLDINPNSLIEFYYK